MSTAQILKHYKRCPFKHHADCEWEPYNLQ